MENQRNETDAAIMQKLPIRFISKVVRGFGRGSSELGIPTANLSREKDDTICSISNYDDLPCGIYWGFARIVQSDDKDEGRRDTESTTIYKTAVSIGFNPYYNNTTKTVEPHLIANSNSLCRRKSSCEETVLNDFYDQQLRLALVGYLRPELPFDGIENLILAIKNDIKQAEVFCDGSGEFVTTEKAWVASDYMLE